MPRKQRDYKAEYQARQRKARQENYKSYGVKRRHLAKQKQQLQHAFNESLLASFPEAIQFEEYTREQARAINRLEQYGVDRDQITNIVGDKRGSDFWKAIRPHLEHESELAKGH